MVCPYKTQLRYPCFTWYIEASWGREREFISLSGQIEVDRHLSLSPYCTAASLQKKRGLCNFSKFRLLSDQVVGNSLGLAREVLSLCKQDSPSQTSPPFERAEIEDEFEFR